MRALQKSLKVCPAFLYPKLTSAEKRKIVFQRVFKIYSMTWDDHWLFANDPWNSEKDSSYFPKDFIGKIQILSKKIPNLKSVLE